MDGLKEVAESLLKWLKPMITAEFYEKCQNHPDQIENSYCKDCCISFCPDCKSSHEEHQTLKVYKASKAVAVRTKDMKESWDDTTEICDYSINNRNIYFVHKKSHQGRTPKIVGGQYVAECEVCCYKLVKHSKFCSVECKVGDVEHMLQLEGRGRGGAEEVMDEPQAMPDFSGSFRKRRRKQLKPSRSPFF